MALPFDLGLMRYARLLAVIACKWKTALEAFGQSYHVNAVHLQIGNPGFKALVEAR